MITPMMCNCKNEIHLTKRIFMIQGQCWQVNQGNKSYWQTSTSQEYQTFEKDSFNMRKLEKRGNKSGQ